MHLIVRPINLLLLAAPFGIASEHFHWGAGLTFILIALAIIPLAGFIAGLTDSLADRLGDRVGGLLEATLGNAAFLILGVLALREGLITIVKASIAGALISNTLFVLGLSFVVGCWRGQRQRFSAEAASNYAKLLALTVVALVLPAIAIAAGVDSTSGEEISGVVAVILIGLYVLYVLFDLFHVKDLAYHEQAGTAEKSSLEPLSTETAPIVEYRAEQPRLGALQARRQRGHEDRIPPGIAALGLALVIAVTVYVSEILVGVTRAVTEQHEPVVLGPLNLGTLSVTPVFVGLVIVPLIGTAAEHLSAIRSAIAGRTEITIAVTAGAAIQVALLAAPLFVLLSFVISPQPLTLLFSPLELAVFALATFLFYLVTEDGEGTWLEGAQLVAFYLIFAGIAFFLPG